MNSRPGAHGATGASAGVGGDGFGRRESPAPFVINDGGVRRARPAGPPDPPAPGLGKLFLSLTGLAAGVFI